MIFDNTIAGHRKDDGNNLKLEDLSTLKQTNFSYLTTKNTKINSSTFYKNNEKIDKNLQSLCEQFTRKREANKRKNMHVKLKSSFAESKTAYSNSKTPNMLAHKNYSRNSLG